VGHGGANRLCPLACQQSLVHLGAIVGRAVQHRVVLGRQHQALVGGEAAQALVARRRGQPRAHPVGVLDTVDVLDQPHPRDLEDVRGVALPQLEVPGDRPDEPAVLGDELFPGAGITLAGPPDQSGHVQISDVRLFSRHRTP
jgi:hypothetical protein